MKSIVCKMRRAYTLRVKNITDKRNGEKSHRHTEMELLEKP